MTVRLYDADISSLIMEKEYPEIFSAGEGDIRESVVHLSGPLGNGSYTEIYFDGVHIGYGSALLAKKALLNFESDFETVEMHFSLKGKSTAVTDSFDRKVTFEASQHNIMYANQMRGEMHWDARDFQLFEVNLSPRFFKKYLPEDSCLFERFREAIDGGDSSLLHPGHHLISLQMYRVISEILHCNRKGIFKRMFLEAKVIELLLMQFEQICTDTPANVTLKRSDVEKIYAVREFILGDIGAECSLIDLAHRVGTNEFTLKKGFRELFGTTVFGFWNDAKMDQAKKMLLEQDMNINEVSDSVGYKNPRHFSAAFKKKFGVIPSRLKKGERGQPIVSNRGRTLF